MGLEGPTVASAPGAGPQLAPHVAREDQVHLEKAKEDMVGAVDEEDGVHSGKRKSIADLLSAEAPAEPEVAGAKCASAQFPAKTIDPHQEASEKAQAPSSAAPLGDGESALSASVNGATYQNDTGASSDSSPKSATADSPKGAPEGTGGTKVNGVGPESGAAHEARSNGAESVDRGGSSVDGVQPDSRAPAMEEEAGAALGPNGHADAQAEMEPSAKRMAAAGRSEEHKLDAGEKGDGGKEGNNGAGDREDEGIGDSKKSTTVPSAAIGEKTVKDEPAASSSDGDPRDSKEGPGAPPPAEVEDWKSAASADFCFARCRTPRRAAEEARRKMQENPDEDPPKAREGRKRGREGSSAKKKGKEADKADGAVEDGEKSDISSAKKAGASSAKKAGASPEDRVDLSSPQGGGKASSASKKGSVKRGRPGGRAPRKEGEVGSGAEGKGSSEAEDDPRSEGDGGSELEGEAAERGKKKGKSPSRKKGGAHRVRAPAKTNQRFALAQEAVKMKDGLRHLVWLPTKEYRALCDSERAAEEREKQSWRTQKKSNIQGTNNMCHQCQRNDKEGGVIRCKNVTQHRYCRPCVQLWYPGHTAEQITEQCPKCTGNCTCKACLRTWPLVPYRGSAADDRVELGVRKLQQMLEHLEKVHARQQDALDFERQRNQEFQIRHVPIHPAERVNCSHCRNAIFDFFYSCECEACDFDLCIHCARDLRQGGGLPPGIVKGIGALLSDSDVEKFDIADDEADSDLEDESCEGVQPEEGEGESDEEKDDLKAGEEEVDNAREGLPEPSAAERNGLTCGAGSAGAGEPRGLKAEPQVVVPWRVNEDGSIPCPSGLCCCAGTSGEAAWRKHIRETRAEVRAERQRIARAREHRQREKQKLRVQRRKEREQEWRARLEQEGLSEAQCPLESDSEESELSEEEEDPGVRFKVTEECHCPCASGAPHCVPPNNNSTDSSKHSLVLSSMQGGRVLEDMIAEARAVLGAAGTQENGRPGAKGMPRGKKRKSQASPGGPQKEDALAGKRGRLGQAAAGTPASQEAGKIPKGEEGPTSDVEASPAPGTNDASTASDVTLDKTAAPVPSPEGRLPARRTGLDVLCARPIAKRVGAGAGPAAAEGHTSEAKEGSGTEAAKAETTRTSTVAGAAAAPPAVANGNGDIVGVQEGSAAMQGAAAGAEASASGAEHEGCSGGSHICITNERGCCAECQAKISKHQAALEEILKLDLRRERGPWQGREVEREALEAKIKAKKAALLDAARKDHLLPAASRRCSADNFILFVSQREVTQSPGKEAAFLRHFMQHWERGEPVLFRDTLKDACHDGLSWEPRTMCRGFREIAKAVTVAEKQEVMSIDCFDWLEMEVNQHHFFDGYLKGSLSLAKNKHALIKLKDWPASADFSDRLARHGAEFERALPLHPYMHPKRGELNLFAAIPPRHIRPDLGPKTYIAYGRSLQVGIGDSVTKLHCDMADAVNILTHSSPSTLDWAKELKVLMGAQRRKDTKTRGILKSQQAEIRKLLDGTAKRSTTSASTSERVAELRASIKRKRARLARRSAVRKDIRAGIAAAQTPSRWHWLVAREGAAQWDIFRREDVPKMRRFIARHQAELKHLQGRSLAGQIYHEIHDQKVFLSDALKEKLFQEEGVESWTFEQKVGEAVLVPAGCPHQVRNIHSCIKVAIDFVSGENLDEVFKLVDDFRRLPPGHRAKEDKLGVGSMLLHATRKVVDFLKKELEVEGSSGAKGRGKGAGK